MKKDKSSDLFLTFVFMNDQISADSVQALQLCQNSEILIVSDTIDHKIFKKYNIAVSYVNNLQKAINLAKGQYLYFPKSDEIITPNMIPECQKQTADSQPDMFGFKAQYVNDNGIMYYAGQWTDLPFDLNLKTLQTSSFAKKVFDLRDMPFIYKTDFLRQQKFLFDDRFGHRMYDVIWLKALINANHIVAVDENLTFQKQRKCGYDASGKDLPQTIYFWEFAQDVLLHKSKQLEPTFWYSFYDAQLRDLYHIMLGMPIPERKKCTQQCIQHFEKNKILLKNLLRRQKNMFAFLTECQETPLVSIILDVTHVSDTMQQCLSSLQAQTLQNFEVICIADAHNENTKMLETVCQSDSRFHLSIEKTNAKAVALKQATGQYVSFVCASDFFHEDWLWMACEKSFRLDTDLTLVGFYRWNSYFKAPIDAVMYGNQEKSIYNLSNALNPALILDVPCFAMLIKRTFALKYSEYVDDELLAACCCTGAKAISDINQAMIYHQDCAQIVLHNFEEILNGLDKIQEQLQNTSNWLKVQDVFITYKWQFLVDSFAEKIKNEDAKNEYIALKKRLSKMSKTDYDIISKDSTLMRKIGRIQTFSYLQLKYFISDFTNLKRKKSLFTKVKKAILFICLLPVFIVQAHAMVKAQMKSSE